ncbi:oligosaccharide flippase family protein [Halorhabdus salina]|uniref:oligosaccharide flippase family protein n=1 Tax=Halorhabdus salina TaxID=2750670 RepID=UPI0015EED9F9|nr:oligosaccharide flippase family protein [Halorhabdus salina]
MSREGGFGLEVSKGFVAKVILMVIGFLGSIVFARTLGPAVYGAYHVLVSVANILDNPIRGLGTACQKRISEHDRDNGAILTIGLGGTTLIGAGTVGILFVASPYLDVFDIQNGTVLAGIVFIGLIFFKILQPLISGTGHFGTSIVLDMVRSIFTIPLQLFLVSFGLGVAGMVYGLAVASLAMVPISLYVLNTRLSIPSRQTVRDVLSYAKFSIPNGFIGSAYGQLDILLLGAVLGSGASGQYKIALQLSLPATLLSMVMGTGLLSEVSSRESQDKEIAQQVTNNVVFASLLAIPMFFGALAMPESIVVTVFGSEYRHAAPLLVGLMIYQIIRTQSSQISSVIEGIDRPDLMLYLNGVTLVVNLTLGIALVYQIGVIGVVAATIVAEGTKFGTMTAVARKEVAYDPLPRPVVYEAIAGGVMFIVVKMIHQWWGVASWFDLLALVGLGAVIYAVVLVSLSDIFMHTARQILSDARAQYLT